MGAFLKEPACLQTQVGGAEAWPLSPQGAWLDGSRQAASVGTRAGRTVAGCPKALLCVNLWAWL